MSVNINGKNYEILKVSMGGATGLSESSTDIAENAVLEKTFNRDGRTLWAVRSNGMCLNNKAEWEMEPMPSNRDDKFIERCRYPNAEAASSCYGSWLADERIQHRKNQLRLKSGISFP